MPPSIHTKTEIKYRNLPSDCFRLATPTVVSRGATNEDVAKAYRDNLEALAAFNASQEKCYALNGEGVDE